MSKGFYDVLKERRTYYGISNEQSVSTDRIKKVVEDAVLYTPTAFNSQSGRVVILFGENHTKLWNIAKDELKKIVPADKFKPTEDKINSFAAGYGTVLFFEDQDVIKGLQENFSLYKENFPVWSLQASGILQYVVWGSLETEGLGASLQHYNPLIDNQVKKEWNIPEHWLLLGQMPFGTPVSTPDAKTFLPIEDRFKVFE